jgi:hypothetical protein
MRGLTAAAVALVLGVACGSADATTSDTDEESKARATLTIVSLDPLRVRGVKFFAGERVKLLLNDPTVKMKAVRADVRGRFTVRFKLAAAGRCTGAVVQAFGSRGSRAMVDVTAPNCSPSPGRGDSDPPFSPPGERP